MIYYITGFFQGNFKDYTVLFSSFFMVGENPLHPKDILRVIGDIPKLLVATVSFRSQYTTYTRAKVGETSDHLLIA